MIDRMVDDRVRALFERAGCTGSPLARSLDGDTEFGLRADEPVVPASAVKALVAETWFAEGRLAPRERVTPGAAERTPGPAGVSLFEDAVLSWRDLVVLMPTIGDNPNAGQDLGHAGRAGPVSRSDRASARETRADERLATTRALTPRAGTRTTPRDMVTPLGLIRSGQAGPADTCAPGRGRMARRRTRHRIASAFRTPVRVAAESGGLAGIVRNEVGVVSLPDGRRYAAAVRTRSRPGSDDAADAAIEAATARAIASRAHRTT